MTDFHDLVEKPTPEKARLTIEKMIEQFDPQLVCTSVKAVRWLFDLKSVKAGEGRLFGRLLMTDQTEMGAGFRFFLFTERGGNALILTDGGLVIAGVPRGA